MTKSLSYIFGLLLFILVGCSSSSPEPSAQSEEPTTASAEETVIQAQEEIEEKLDAEHVKNIEEQEKAVEAQLSELSPESETENSEPDSAPSDLTETSEEETESAYETETSISDSNEVALLEIDVGDQELVEETSVKPEAELEVIQPELEPLKTEAEESVTAETVAEPVQESEITTQKGTTSSVETATQKKVGSFVEPEPALLPVLKPDVEKTEPEVQTPKDSSMTIALPEQQEEEQEGLLNKIKSGAKRLLGLFSDSENKNESDMEDIELPEPSAEPEIELEAAPEPMKTEKANLKWTPNDLAISSSKKLVSCEEVPKVMNQIHQQLEKTKTLDVADRRLRDNRADQLMPVIHFDFDQISIKPTYQALVRQQSACVMDALEKQGKMIIQVEGHADERGSEEYNMALGHRRASAVVSALKVYLPKSTVIRTISYGEEFPLVRGSGHKVWSQNRRVEFTFLLKP